MTNKTVTQEEKITDKQIMNLIHHLIESDAAFESDMVQMDIMSGRKVSEREKTLADLVGKIYMIVHPRFGCRHWIWEANTEALVKLLEKPQHEPKR